MPAYSVPVQVTCAEMGCRSRATEEVFNLYNESRWRFCKKHAKKRVAELNKQYKPKGPDVNA